MKEAQKAYIIIKLKVPLEIDLPTDDDGNVIWDKKTVIYDFVQHWLEEGYFTNDGIVNLPNDVEYEYFKLFLDKKVSEISKIMKEK